MIEINPSANKPTVKHKSLQRIKSFFGNFFKFALLLTLVAAIAWGTWSYKMYRDVKSQLMKLSSIQGQQELATQEIKAITDKVAKHLVLPSDEEPVIATVTNAEALAKEQPFYIGASDDDKVIIYAKAGKAILYNPTKDIIVNVGPVYVEQPKSEESSPTLSPKPTPTPTPTPETDSAVTP